MEFIRLSQAIAAEWDNLVYDSDDGWLYSLSFWQEMITNIHEWGYEDHSFAVYQNGNMVAVMPMQRKRDGSLASAAMGMGGPTIRVGVHASHREKILRAIFVHVEEIANQLRAPTIAVAISPLTKSSLNNKRGVNPLVNHGFQDTSTHTRIINLQKSEAELFAELAQDARRSVRLAEKAGYTVERGCWSELLDDYYRVHAENYHRTGVNPHPVAYFEGIAYRISSRRHSVLWVGRNAAGRPIAFHNCARFGQTSLYWTGCCETEYLESGINYLLCWYALLGAKADGCLWYEIGEAFPNVRKGKLHGLTIFKGKFGGELHRFFKGEIALAQPPAVRSVVRNWLDATHQLLNLVLGERATALIVKGEQSTYRSIRRSSNLLRRIRRISQSLVQPRIAFIKPYWKKEEMRIGLHASVINTDTALAQFEHAFRSKLRIHYDSLVIATSSGRTALSLVLRVLKEKYPERKRVLLPSYGCKGTFDPIVNNELIPFYVDIDQDLLPNQEYMKRYMDDDVLACLLVHMAGKRMEAEDIIQAAKGSGIMTIEDHCQNLGGNLRATSKNVPEPDFCLYSFGIGKSIMATAGGALVANVLQQEIEAESRSLEHEDIRLAQERFSYFYENFFKSKSLKTLLRLCKKPYEVNQSQFNYLAMNPLDAILLVHQIEKLEKIIEKRKKNAMRIYKALTEFPNVFRPQDPNNHIYTKFSVILRDKNTFSDFRSFMSDHGVELESMYIPLHLRDFGRRFYRTPLSVTEALYSRVVNLPVRPNLTNKDKDRVIALIKNFGRSRSQQT